MPRDCKRIWQIELYQTMAMLDTWVTGRWWLYFTKDKKGRLKWPSHDVR